jgi:hypothetical protein
MAAQVLAEMSQESKDQKLLHQIYNSILFDFRIWCKSEFFVQVKFLRVSETFLLLLLKAVIVATTFKGRTIFVMILLVKKEVYFISPKKLNNSSA